MVDDLAKADQAERALPEALPRPGGASEAGHGAAVDVPKVVCGLRHDGLALMFSWHVTGHYSLNVLNFYSMMPVRSNTNHTENSTMKTALGFLFVTLAAVSHSATFTYTASLTPGQVVPGPGSVAGGFGDAKLILDTSKAGAYDYVRLQVRGNGVPGAFGGGEEFFSGFVGVGEPSEAGTAALGLKSIVHGSVNNSPYNLDYLGFIPKATFDASGLTLADLDAGRTFVQLDNYVTGLGMVRGRFVSQSVPEPASLAALGLALLAVRRRRR